MVLILSVIAVIIDLSQKISRLEDHGSNPKEALLYFYPYWSIWLINTFLPVAIFISVIYFTSRLTMKTEIVAALSSGISFYRITKPYVLVALLIATTSLLVNNLILPWSNIKKNKFQYEYLLSNKKRGKYYEKRKISAQISPNEYLFAQNYDRIEKFGSSFHFQKIDSSILKEQLSASSFRWNQEDSIYKLRNVYIRKIMPDGTDSIAYLPTLDKKISVTPDEILPEGYVAETMNSMELYNFIEKQRFKGSASINGYLNELQQRNSLPFSTFILTLLALALSSKKRRGGIGLNLALGLVLAFIYIFFNQVSLTYSEKGYVSPFIAAWLPNIIFGIITLVLYLQRANS